jgi:hypothetical protein
VNKGRKNENEARKERRGKVGESKNEEERKEKRKEEL